MINKFFTLIKYIKEKTNINDIDLNMTVSDFEKIVVLNNLNIPEHTKNFDTKAFKKSLLSGYNKSRNQSVSPDTIGQIIFVDFKTKEIITKNEVYL